jgi:hypothetical protein
MALKGQTKAKPTLAEAKARQSIKIREFGAALRRAGINSLDAQARALGLKRSTAWTILNAGHKASGLSAKSTADGKCYVSIFIDDLKAAVARP